MAEFGMKHSQSRDSFHSTPQGGVEWYAPGAGSYATTTSYAAPGASSTYHHSQAQGSYMPVSTPAYGSGDPSTNFADEPPLLEGACASQPGLGQHSLGQRAQTPQDT